MSSAGVMSNALITIKRTTSISDSVSAKSKECFDTILFYLFKRDIINPSATTIL
ncbi:hypothetical protein LEP1GSC062_2378 [Leptospira alexanderi serovar Manhao 3 str. L 60]|uniref:Uncharacterized protein n=1 Tax=Leptospira alexanderi serovar Manhao 3 str. L 60 TaxID=1049759 RepID=V6I4L2_9LEPT|nr:hypothetical protein LEP1GSC062_2378 [Leptospira alexanderi serovar Manhao 3 str. L 60]